MEDALEGVVQCCYWRVRCSVVTEGPEFRSVPVPASNWPHLSIRYVSDVLGGPGFELSRSKYFSFLRNAQTCYEAYPIGTGLIPEDRVA